ncbi:MAG: prohibitin family protein [Candidatus Firestonebacteria bacterium]|nr:prohibitin family protein [Candidatus Firestonebacteria bacterium]
MAPSEIPLYAGVPKIARYITLGVVTLIFLWGLFFTVKPGEVAVLVRLGKLQGSYPEGFYLKIPLIDTVEKFTIKIQRADIETEAFSRDLQTIKVKIVVNHRVEQGTITSIFRNLGVGYVQSVIEPISQEVLKSILAKYSAENIISSRIEVAAELSATVKRRLAEKQIIVTDLSITDFDFSEAFIKSVEDKQIAEQNAKKAEKDVERVKREAEQQVARARGEAEGLRLQREAVTPMLISLRRVEAQIKAIDKWDGKLPTFVGSEAMPFIEIKKDGN